MEAKYNYELIKDYLEGLLDSKTAEGVQQLIKNDETAKNIALGILTLDKKFLGNEQAFDAYIDGLLQTQQEIIDRHQVVRKSFPWVKIAATVLLIAVVGLASYRYLQPNLMELVNQEISTPYPNTPTFRSSTTALDKGYTAYLKGDYSEASALLSKFDNAESLFFNGLCQLYLGNSQKAVELFNKADLSTTRYEEQGAWYAALAYVSLNEIDRAKIILLKISTSQNHFKKDRAELLLEKIKD